MAKTRHIQRRLSQRGIKSETLALVAQFGFEQGDKIILNKQACIAASQALYQMKRLLDEGAEKGGYVLVEADGVEITTYRLNSYGRNRRRVHSQETCYA